VRFSICEADYAPEDHVNRCSEKCWSKEEEETLHDVGGQRPVRGLLCRDCAADVADGLNYEVVY
jgi:hypothetical protein